MKKLGQNQKIIINYICYKWKNIPLKIFEFDDNFKCKIIFFCNKNDKILKDLINFFDLLVKYRNSTNLIHLGKNKFLSIIIILTKMMLILYIYLIPSIDKSKYVI